MYNVSCDVSNAICSVRDVCGNVRPSISECTSSIFKFQCAHLKFIVYGCKQANKHIYTHIHNAVSLVWGLFRLTPINS